MHKINFSTIFLYSKIIGFITSASRQSQNTIGSFVEVSVFGAKVQFSWTVFALHNVELVL